MIRPDAALRRLASRKLHEMADALFEDAEDWPADASSFALEARFVNARDEAFTLEVKLDLAPPPAEDEAGEGFATMEVGGRA